MTKIDSADMSGELAPEYIKTAVFNMVKIITILSVADWVEVFKEFTEWVILSTPTKVVRIVVTPL